MNEELKIFKALADETRLKIIKILLKGEHCVCKIVPHTNRSQSTVSNQLSKLENLGIVKSKRDGRRICYYIVNDKIEKILNIFKKGV
ncbi:transcriptional regulator [Tepiditoga spiralis]|uniref:Transcriptional regulator n=1 Tax=Tepiditoga spiralis TaxID=2108365 RepID=A0A7G1G4Y1_9BACT|nr:metalloregulator ArsR/SmtB family transcription factor [Tepiditoga spiralis]BBE31451.1 transcriptional regulator [Tepiditoga spiralis]